MLSLISVQGLENINLVVGVAVLGAALAYYVEDGHKLGNQHLFKLLGLKIMLYEITGHCLMFCIIIVKFA